jgi:NAD(P)-dependent dehydrogenase (short-subunit alcohol dehydrogenase family)
MVTGVTRRVAVVTGASRGIGLAEAEALVSRGYHVVTCSRSPAAVPGGVHVAADLGCSDGARALAEEVRSRYARLDVLVNNAGGSRPFAKRLLETADADWRGMMAANLDSTFYCIRELAPLMIDSGGGFIVNTSSVHGLTGGRVRLGAYAAAKAALIALTKAAARELGPRGVTVFAIAPGLVDTENLREGMGGLVDELGRQTPVGRPARPQEIAEVVASLVDTQARPLNGAVIEISGGKGDVYVRPSERD